MNTDSQHEIGKHFEWWSQTSSPLNLPGRTGHGIERGTACLHPCRLFFARGGGALDFGCVIEQNDNQLGGRTIGYHFIHHTQMSAFQVFGIDAAFRNLLDTGLASMSLPSK